MQINERNKHFKLFLCRSNLHHISFPILGSITSLILPLAFTLLTNFENRNKTKYPNEILLKSPVNTNIDYTNLSVSERISPSPIQNYKFDRRTYFQYLSTDTYQPWNSVGSCGLVALISIMSYYDTFYNDDIIPEIYDRNYKIAKSFNEVILHSPGVEVNSYIVSDNHLEDNWQIHCENENHETYYEFCERNISNDLQCRLSLLYLDELNRDRQPILNWGSFQWWYLQKVLDNFYGKEKIVTNYFNNLSQEEYKYKINQELSNGNPILVGFMDKNQQNGHGAVAYEHCNGEIFLNMGLGNNVTHVKLLSGDYENGTITGIATLNFSRFDHKHSNNYIINGNYYCGCGYKKEKSKVDFVDITKKKDTTIFCP